MPSMYVGLRIIIRKQLMFPKKGTMHYVLCPKLRYYSNIDKGNDTSSYLEIIYQNNNIKSRFVFNTKS